jgi:endonuclease III
MPRETKLARYQRALDILKKLHELYPNATTELNHANPFELLISTILSAQATDVSVNAAAPALYKKYPDAFTLAQATPEEVIPYIKTIGLYRNKAKNIVAAAQQLVEKHNGEVPNDFEAVTSLPGVGRKTANVVLSNAFGHPAIAVDTHVGRLSRRLGLSKHDNPDKVEADLQKVFPVEQWIFAHHALILHGRRVCQARKPLCEVCALSALCPNSTM